jgi:hypothetical protein
MVSWCPVMPLITADVLRDFRAPKPCPYDASAATVAARGLQMLYLLLLPTESVAAKYYLSRAFKLIEDTLRECSTPAATLKNGKVDFGSGGWETILKVSKSSDGLRPARLQLPAFYDQWQRQSPSKTDGPWARV